MVLNPLVSLFGRLVARSGRKRGNRQTDRRTDGQSDRSSTVTLAAHARGLIILIEGCSNRFMRYHMLDFPFVAWNAYTVFGCDTTT